MNVKQLIEELKKHPENREVRIFDWKKNMSDDDGEGNSGLGIYEFDIAYEKAKPKGFLALSFDNPDIQEP